MKTLKEIDDVARMWQKTKDKKYKDEWYKYIKEWADGVNNLDRRDVSSGASDRRDASKPKTVR